jgi:hypothetical protein
MDGLSGGVLNIGLAARKKVYLLGLTLTQVYCKPEKNETQPESNLLMVSIPA